MEKDGVIATLLDAYGGPAPRYTSYPPATQFQPVENDRVFQDEVRGLALHDPLSLYFHIPFCRSLCSYCGCLTRIVHDDKPIQDYVRFLEKEINLAATLLPGRMAVSHIHFGGGSPNLLLRDDLCLLMNAVRAGFAVGPDVEIAMEVDPRQMSAEKASLYAQSGFNRISLGVQDFQMETQRAINRIQPFSQIENCVRWLRDAGIGGINFDLMYGLPYQTVDSIADNVRKAVSLGPDRIALFGYAHVPWMKPHQKILERHPLPDSIERYQQAEQARQVLVQCGYRPIGMDHFARQDDAMMAALADGALKRNFQGYTNDNAKTLLGFGVSAISRFPNAYFQNSSNIGRYQERIGAGTLPLEKAMTLDREDHLRAEIIETLMCYFSVSCDAVCRRHGFPESFLDAGFEKLAVMEKDGLVRRDGRNLAVTETGKPFVRRICACFDAYYQEKENHHARAV